MWQICIKYFCCILKCDYSQGKKICEIVWVACWTSHFHRTSFLLERMPDELWIFRLRYLVDTFLKTIKVSCHFKENHCWNLLSTSKFKLLKIRFFVKCVSAMSLIASQNLKTFLVRILVILTCNFFGHCKMKCVTILKICVTQ